MNFIPKTHQKYCIEKLTSTSRPESAGLILDMGLG